MGGEYPKGGGDIPGAFAPLGGGGGRYSYKYIYLRNIESIEIIHSCSMLFYYKS